MKLSLLLTTFLFYSYAPMKAIRSNDIKITSSNYCNFIEVENCYYELVVESFIDSNRKSLFFGFCDSETLKKWKPCPFECSSTKIPGPTKIYRQPCDLDVSKLQPACNCNGVLKSHKLTPSRDFPTCLLGGHCLNAKCTLVSRHGARAPAVIYDCIHCMTKHPDVRTSTIAFSSWRRAKRNKKPPSPIKTLDFHQQRHCSLAHKYRSYVPVQNKQFYTQKVTSELELEWNSDTALSRILRSISSGRHFKKHRKFQRYAGPTDEDEVEDDDNDDDDNIGEDIAIEESDNDEKEIETTTEELEKSEKRHERLKELEHNLTLIEEKQNCAYTTVTDNILIMFTFSVKFWFV